MAECQAIHSSDCPENTWDKNVCANVLADFLTVLEHKPRAWWIQQPKYFKDWAVDQSYFLTGPIAMCNIE